MPSRCPSSTVSATFKYTVVSLFSSSLLPSNPIFYEKSNPQVSPQTRKLEESYGSISFHEHSLQTSNPSELSQREKKAHPFLQLLFNLTFLPLRLCPKCTHPHQLLLSEEVTALRVRRCFVQNLSHQRHIQQWRCGCYRRNQRTFHVLSFVTQRQFLVSVFLEYHPKQENRSLHIPNSKINPQKKNSELQEDVIT